jgi:tripartite-type tricarboxylate transporter receptor subunit TctC
LGNKLSCIQGELHMVKSILKFILWSLTLSLGLIHAQTYPVKPIKIIVPYSPGGFADSGVRAISEALGTRLGTSIVIENRPGASGVIGVMAVSGAPADGYTLLLGFDGTLITYPYMVSKPPFQVLKDLSAISKIGDSAMVLAAHPSLPAKNIAELIDLSRQKGLPLPYGSSGLGSTPHLAGELFKARTNVALEHIAYKGGGQATIDTLGGQIPMVFTTLATVQQYIKSGKLNALGVTSAKRLSALPDTPTFIEGGVPGFVLSTWIGLFAPPATPKAILEKIQTELSKVLVMPSVKERLATLGIEPSGNTHEQFIEQISSDLAMWGPIVKKANINLD